MPECERPAEDDVGSLIDQRCKTPFHFLDVVHGKVFSQNKKKTMFHPGKKKY